jgi:hypothetical protein
MLTVEMEHVAVTAALTVKLEVADPAKTAGAVRQSAKVETVQIQICFFYPLISFPPAYHSLL